MSYGLGPRPIDFAPLAQLGDRFFDSYDKARLLAYGDQAAKIYDRSLSLSGLAPQAPVAPVGPVADAGGVPDALGTPKMRTASFGLSGPIGAAAAPADPALAAARSLPTFAQGRIPDLLAAAAQQYGQDPAVVTRIAQIESSLNPSAKNPSSSAGGLGQFIDSTWAAYGRGKSKFDPAANADALARLAKDNADGLRNALGRDPTPGEIYLAHQQGLGGAIKLLSNPGARAVDLVGANAVRLNGGNASMTAGQFASLWDKKMGMGGASAPVQAAQADVPLPPPRPAQLASADPNFMPPPSPAMARVQQEAAARGIGQQPVDAAPAASAAPAAPSRPAQFLTAQAQNRAGIPTAGPEGNPATPSDFVPGSTAVPAQPAQYGQPAPGAQPVGPTQTALSLLSQAQKDNLRAMLANPVTRQHAMELIDRLNVPEQFEIKEAGGQFYRIGKTTGQAQVISGIAKPQEWTPFTGPDGNAYLVNKHSGQTKRMIEGGKFEDITDPSQLAQLRPPGYQGPVQRDASGHIVYPGENLFAGRRTDVTDPAELARVRPPGYQGPVQRTDKGGLDFPGSGAAGINIQNAGEAEAQKVRIKQYTDMVDEGAKARSAAIDLENLRELGRGLGAQGATAGFKESLGPYAQALGVEIKGLPDIQAYQAVIKRLTPNMRPPGSGSTSNYEEKLYGQALPGLLMHPQAREMALDVMQAGNDFAAERARIGQAAINGEISHAESAQQLKALPDPLDRFREFRKNNPTIVRDALASKAPTGAAPPSTANPPRKVTKDEFDKLPSGTPFIAPDGSVRVKP